MESIKKFGLLKFDKRLTIFIKEIVNEEEIFQDLKTIKNMKSFVDISLSELNVNKISKNKFKVDIQLLIEERDKDLVINLLRSKKFTEIPEIKRILSKEDLKNNSYKKTTNYLH